MIEIWPAIDLIEGQSVRLTEGDYATSEAMTRTPEEAIAFYEQFSQVRRIHVVDLIGALHKGPKELSYITQLIQKSRVPVEIGGGIRSKEIIEKYFAAGAAYLIIGTKGLQDLDWLAEMTDAFPDKLYLGLDAKEERVAVNGWTQETGQTIYQVVEQTNKMRLGGIIYTDIKKDGQLSGPNFSLTGELVKRSEHPVIASGGIRSLEDIKQLDRLDVHAAIVGKAANTEEFWRGIT